MPKLKEEEVLYLLEEQLPDMLERRPDLEPRAFRAFLKVFTTKEETAAILAEMRELHGEFRHFRAEMRERLDQVDQRLEQVDQRFDQVDQRLDQVDQRLDQVDQRLDQVDQRLDQVDQRFEQVDQRFGQVDQRFEKVEQRLDQVEQGLQEVRQEMAQGFQEVRQEMAQGFQEVRQEIGDLRSWTQLVVGRLQTRVGRNLEDLVAGALRVALRRSDIKPEQLRLRQVVVDEQGLVGLPGKRRFEIDILAEDGQLTVFEIKSFCDTDDVNNLADRVTLIQALHPDRKVEGVMIALGIDYGVPERCAELGITLVYHGDEVPASSLS